jgi:hypothetical protein
MLSSTSSSELRAGEALLVPEAPDPLVVEVVPQAHERPLPALRMGVTGVTAVLVFAVALGAWEGYWRADGSAAVTQNSDGLWARERRRIDNGEGNKLVLVGASRMLFNVQLHVWERLSGDRPIQLAMEGTSPMPMLEDLAEDPDFRGRLLVGVAPDVFFSGFLYRGGVLDYYRKETPSQRAGQLISMHLVEPWFAYLDPDFALVTVMKRQGWPARPGVPTHVDVRKLAETGPDRNTHMWRKVETDAGYASLAQSIWAQHFEPPPDFRPEELPGIIDAQITRAVAAVEKLRARGVEVVFVRPPSNGRYLEFENRAFPREKTWDVLLERTGAPGIHFEDYPDQQGLELPEWSHLSAADAERYTEALYRSVERLRQPTEPRE